MISLDDYMMGRQQTHRRELTAEVKRNAPEMVRRTNLVLNRFYADNPSGATRTVNSGWRPPSLNRTVPGAAQQSLHMRGAAVDLSDDDEELDDWLMSPNGEQALRDIGLWHERPEYTPRWSHLQLFPPRSGNLHFIP